MQTIRVLHFLDSLSRGGAEMQALDVCRNAANAGLQMTVVAGGGGALEGGFRESGAEFFRFDRRYPVDLHLASQIRRVIREREIGIVHGYQAVDGLHLYLATRGIRDVRKVLSFQGFIQDKKNRLASRFLIPRMDANIAVSRGLQKWLADKDGLDTGNFRIIYNGADPARLTPTGRSLKKELNLSENTLLIGMIGAFYRDPRKDQFTVCRALPKVFEDIENVHCVFAGGVEHGAERKFEKCVDFCVENSISDRVHFLGARSDVADILTELDVFVFSSLHEGLPVAVSEAMLAGVPMIVSDIEPLLEATRNGEFAEVFPVGDHQALSDKLVKLLRNQSLRAELADRTQRFAFENFSINAHLRDLRQLYENLIRKDGPI
jgi:glycosyltransferase involved in cell wall biosynthesis